MCLQWQWRTLFTKNSLSLFNESTEIPWRHQIYQWILWWIHKAMLKELGQRTRIFWWVECKIKKKNWFHQILYKFEWWGAGLWLGKGFAGASKEIWNRRMWGSQLTEIVFTSKSGPHANTVVSLYQQRICTPNPCGCMKSQREPNPIYATYFSYTYISTTNFNL